MGAYLSQAKTDKDSHCGENESLRFGLSAMQGWRIGMEDAHAAIVDLDVGTSFFAVYDGHGGKEVARFCARHLHEELVKAPAYKADNLSEGLIASFLRMDELMCSEAGRIELKAIAADKGNGSSKAGGGSGGPAPPSPLILDGESAGAGGAVENDTGMKRQRVGAGGAPPAEAGAAAAVPGELQADIALGDASAVDAAEGDAAAADGSTAKALVAAEGSPGGPAGGVRGRRRSSRGARTQPPLNGGEEEKEEEEDHGIEGEEEEEDEEEVDMTGGDGSDEAGPSDGRFGGREQSYVGPDAGCTAVVAVVKNRTLLVANAGDSRCVLSRNGQAVEMSVDHKPGLKLERERIMHAGGYILEGRINGSLNLSRAIGDCEYKQNRDLPPAAQIVTAVPDVRLVELSEGDEFMVLACDGIWDVLSSQKVVDEVHAGLEAGESLIKVCEELMDACVAPNSEGNGIGMDNMSIMVVQFKGLGGSTGQAASAAVS